MWCPNCGKAEIKEKEGENCEVCGFKYIAVRVIFGECSPAYCNKCGCNYADGCSIHVESDQVKKKW